MERSGIAVQCSALLGLWLDNCEYNFFPFGTMLVGDFKPDFVIVVGCMFEVYRRDVQSDL